MSKVVFCVEISIYNKIAAMAAYKIYQSIKCQQDTAKTELEHLTE